MYSDWSATTNSRNAVPLFKYTEDGVTYVKPYLYFSKLLPPSFMGKSSLLRETGSLAYGLCAIKNFISFRILSVYTDSASLVAVLRRRFESKICQTNSMMRRLIEVINGFQFEIQFLAGPHNYASDFLSWYQHLRGQPLKVTLDQVISFTDFEAIDEALDRHPKLESKEEFLKQGNQGIPD